jgi:outer membrane receptor protein involved in Fe transport
VNSGSGYGVELAVNWQPLSWWTLNLAYSWQKISLDSLDLASGGLSAQQAAQNSLPQNQLSLRSKLVFSEQWQTNWWLQYIDTIENVNSLTLTDTVKIPSRVQLSANVIWTPRQNMEVMLAGRNLLYDERLQYAAELVSPPTEIERDIFLQLSWKF